MSLDPNTEIMNAVANAEKTFNGDAYAIRAFEAYLFGYSFAWLYGKQMEQANSAVGPHGVSTPVNSFYVDASPMAISTGQVAPDENVLYANAWIKVASGQPIVVQTPNVRANGQFSVLQMANSATENYQAPYPSPTLNSTSVQSIANPDGGLVLFYASGDNPNLYTGNFTQKIAVNTNISFLTARVLVDPSLQANSPDLSTAPYFSVPTVAELDAQYVAATYDAFAANNHSMSGLTNQSSTDTSSKVLDLYKYYSQDMVGTHFWEMLAQAFSQSPPPSTGIGSEAVHGGMTALTYSQSLSEFGLIYSGGASGKYSFDPSILTRAQFEDIIWAASEGNKFLLSLTTAASNGTASWTNVPSTLGNYANDLPGYITRDLAHAANSPDTAVYPLTYNDSNGSHLNGANSYVMVLKHAATTGAPPLAPVNISAFPNILDQSSAASHKTIINQGGFWSITAYDLNYNVTPAIKEQASTLVTPQVASYQSAVLSQFGIAADFNNPNTKNPVYSLSSLEMPPNPPAGTPVSTPPISSIPAIDQFKVEANGDIILILSPYRPSDPAYANNWLPTPLLAYDNATNTYTTNAPNTPGVSYELMLRVYNPNIGSNGPEAVMYDNASGSWIDSSGLKWNFPAITPVSGVTQAQDLSAYITSLETNNYIYNSGGSNRVVGGLGLNTYVYSSGSSQFNISNDGVSLKVSKSSDSQTTTDVLTNFQQVKFSDATYVFDLNGANDLAVYSLYSGAFDRPADNTGFRFWADQVDAGKLSVTDAAELFLTTPEFIASGENKLDNTQFVEALYQQILGRHVDDAGLSYWTSALNDGVSRAVVLAEIAQSIEAIQYVGQHMTHGLLTT